MLEMKKRYTISDQKGYYCCLSFGEILVFRTFSSILCWSAALGKVVWEHEFINPRMVGEKQLERYHSLVISHNFRKALDIEIVAIDSLTGEMAWNRAIEFRIKQECFAIFGDTLYIYGSGADDRFKIIEIDPSKGDLLREYRAPKGQFLLHDGVGLYIAGSDGIFSVKESGFVQVSSISVRACLSIGKKMVSLLENLDTEFYLGVWDFEKNDCIKLVEVPNNDPWAWKIFPLNERRIFARNSSADLYYVIDTVADEFHFFQMHNATGHKIEQLACLGEACFALREDIKSGTQSVAKILINPAPKYEEILDIKFPEMLTSIEGLLIVGALGAIEVWQ